MCNTETWGETESGATETETQEGTERGAEKGTGFFGEIREA